MYKVLAPADVRNTVWLDNENGSLRVWLCALPPKNLHSESRKSSVSVAVVLVPVPAGDV